MKAKVRFFARLRELAGRDEMEVELGEGFTVGELLQALCQQFPRLADYGESLMYSVNAEYVPATYPLKEGDEVALIPPVSGGGDAV